MPRDSENQRPSPNGSARQRRSLFPCLRQTNVVAEADKEDLSTAVRDLIARGRLFLALERYREGKASLSKAAEVAGVSVSEMMDFLIENGAPADLTVEDYRESLLALREIW